METYFNNLFRWGIAECGGVIAILNWLIFPDSAFEISAIAVIIAMGLDIITRYRAIAKNNGGYINALRTRRICSHTLWKGTSIKIYSYFMVALLAGLSYRVTPLQQLGVAFSYYIYAMMFFREAQSVIENLMDAGADLKWLAVWLKKKETDFVEKEEGGSKDE